jgi:hypothetical protein
MIRALALVPAVLLAVCVTAGPTNAHPHEVFDRRPRPGPGHGPNHPGFQALDADGLRLSCAGVLEPANSGPAGYGLETARHGPDARTPGQADGCYATEGNPQDSNPAID